MRVGYKMHNVTKSFHLVGMFISLEKRGVFLCPPSSGQSDAFWSPKAMCLFQVANFTTS